MSSTPHYLGASEAARRLGVSAKALRLYEQRGLIGPVRTAAGWRAYGPQDMTRAAQIVSLRALGFSLVQITQVLDGKPHGLERVLAAHQAALEVQIRQLADTVGKVRDLRTEVTQGRTPTINELAGLLAPAPEVCVAFDLPWPWGGERFELRRIPSLTYIIGPLGSGKTRLAQCLADELPNAAFLGLDRLAPGPTPPDGDDGQTLASRAVSDPECRLRLDQATAWLVEHGATRSGALSALLAGLESGDANITVVDMIEEGLDQITQETVIAWLRRRGAGARPVFMLTRSSSILDLTAIGPDEAIILCPANHSPPVQVAACPGAPGYEAVATCLASPAVRARTAGVVAVRQPVISDAASGAG